MRNNTSYTYIISKCTLCKNCSVKLLCICKYCYEANKC